MQRLKLSFRGTTFGRTARGLFEDPPEVKEQFVISEIEFIQKAKRSRSILSQSRDEKPQKPQA